MQSMLPEPHKGCVDAPGACMSTANNGAVIPVAIIAVKQHIVLLCLLRYPFILQAQQDRCLTLYASPLAHCTQNMGVCAGDGGKATAGQQWGLQFAKGAAANSTTCCITLTHGSAAAAAAAASATSTAARPSGL